MLIALTIRTLIAVFGLTAVFQIVQSQYHEARRHRHNTSIENTNYIRNPRSYNSSVSLHRPGELLNPRENQKLLQTEGRERNEVECCPTVEEMIEPNAGENQNGQYVELFHGEYRQRFYERSCHPDILNRPCRFMDRKLHGQSKCVQKYTYTYALVKSGGGGAGDDDERNRNFPRLPAAAAGPDHGWTMDYIKVRSGCTCVVVPNRKKRGKKHKKLVVDQP